MSTAEIKLNLHQLIDKIQDSKTLTLIYQFIFSKYKQTEKLEDKVLTHFTSESSLSKDRNSPEEDAAWKKL